MASIPSRKHYTFFCTLIFNLGYFGSSASMSLGSHEPLTSRACDARYLEESSRSIPVACPKLLCPAWYLRCELAVVLYLASTSVLPVLEAWQFMIYVVDQGTLLVAKVFTTCALPHLP